MTFKDLLNKQAELDRMIDRERPNGFKPRERTQQDIKLSMIAEIIEFNEETLETHKTWKEKKFDIDKAKEEAIDILFFFLQLLNCKETNQYFVEMIVKNIDNGSLKLYSQKKDYNLLKLVQSVSDFCIMGIYDELIRIFASLDMTTEDIIEEYMEKWHKNVKRIEEEWTNASEKK